MSTIILNGRVDDDRGLPCTVGFDYGLTTAYGTTAVAGTGMRTGDTFSYTLTTLTPGQTYHYRAWATNADGTGYGSDVTFTVPAIITLPLVFTMPAENIGESNATLKGASQDALTVWFEWGVALEYNQRTLGMPNSAPPSFESYLSGLHEGTAYHYRAAGSNHNGIGYGQDRMFVAVTRDGFGSPVDPALLGAVV